MHFFRIYKSGMSQAHRIVGHQIGRNGPYSYLQLSKYMSYIIVLTYFFANCYVNYIHANTSVLLAKNVCTVAILLACVCNKEEKKSNIFSYYCQDDVTFHSLTRIKSGLQFKYAHRYVFVQVYTEGMSLRCTNRLSMKNFSL